uniref:Uncharacterized protein n=1 Tax=Pavo cristatus TaxID=9049 RepID=A0A8C9ET03_PAVCR
MGLFQGDLINVLFTNKEPSNLSLNKISMKGCWHSSSSLGDSTAPLAGEHRCCHCA